MNSTGYVLPDIEETPYLLIDATAMERNLSQLADRIRETGSSLRPHIKTHKLPRIARRQVELGAVGITVAKLSEAEVMADAGIEDIFVAYPIVVESKIKRALRLDDRIHLTLGVDSRFGAKRLSESATKTSHTLNVRLEVDTGLRRTGTPPDEARELARYISRLSGLRLTGIYTYRGAVLGGSPTLDIEAAGTEEGRIMSDVAEGIEAEGIHLEDVSVGSTPTAMSSALGDRVTEVRPGTYVFNDRMQSTLGSCKPEDRAAMVVATIISRPSKDFAVVDAGSKTFATDVQPGKAPLDLDGFGEIFGHPGIILDRMWEEHGTLTGFADNIDFKIGDRVGIFPNHICSTVNLHNSAYLLHSDGTIEHTSIFARGMLH